MIKTFSEIEIKDEIEKIWIKQNHLQSVCAELLDLNETNFELQGKSDDVSPYEIRRNTNKIQKLLDLALWVNEESMNKLV